MDHERSSELRSFPRKRESRGHLFGFLGSPWVPAFARTSGLAGAVALATATVTQALHACDPVEDEGWRVLATVETTGVRDGPPVEANGDWFVDRVTTLLPLCNYFNAIGNYSLRSYSLDPFEQTERVAICRAGVAVAPYAGPCPPK